MGDGDEGYSSIPPEEPGGGPQVGESEEKAQEALERCRTERAELEPKETADCAGLDLAERYQNEEDGGS